MTHETDSLDKIGHLLFFALNADARRSDVQKDLLTAFSFRLYTLTRRKEWLPASGYAKAS